MHPSRSILKSVARKCMSHPMGSLWSDLRQGWQFVSIFTTVQAPQFFLRHTRVGILCGFLIKFPDAGGFYSGGSPFGWGATIQRGVTLSVYKQRVVCSWEVRVFFFRTVLLFQTINLPTKIKLGWGGKLYLAIFTFIHFFIFGFFYISKSHIVTSSGSGVVAYSLVWTFFFLHLCPPRPWDRLVIG